jgi:predicted solute-binding protein
MIGDTALFADHHSLGLEKIDLGEEWTALTQLPFVYAFWAGRPGAVGGKDVETLLAVRDQGVSRAEEVAAAYLADNPDVAGARGEREARLRRSVQYLLENVRYDFGEREQEGLRTFYNFAAELGLIPSAPPLSFY